MTAESGSQLSATHVAVDHCTSTTLEHFPRRPAMETDAASTSNVKVVGSGTAVTVIGVEDDEIERESSTNVASAPCDRGRMSSG